MPYIRDFTKIFLHHFQEVQDYGSDSYLAGCPAHEDRRPSLLITETDDCLLIYCRAGCRTSDVLAAMRVQPQGAIDR